MMKELHPRDNLAMVRLFGGRYFWTIENGRYVLRKAEWPESLDEALEENRKGWPIR